MGWIGCDLDGTLAEHYWPQKGPYEHTRIGSPVAPMVERIKQWRKEGREVRIFTARVGPADAGYDSQAAAEAIGLWCEKYLGERLPITATKDFQMVELWDDRAVRVIMNTGERCCG